MRHTASATTSTGSTMSGGCSLPCSGSRSCPLFCALCSVPSVLCSCYQFQSQRCARARVCAAELTSQELFRATKLDACLDLEIGDKTSLARQSCSEQPSLLHVLPWRASNCRFTSLLPRTPSWPVQADVVPSCCDGVVAALSGYPLVGLWCQCGHTCEGNCCARTPRHHGHDLLSLFFVPKPAY